MSRGTASPTSSGLVYVDTAILIYTVERHASYEPLVRPLWQAAHAGTIDVVTSELTLMETLVGRLRIGDAALQADYELALLGTDLRLLLVTLPVLRQAADLRAAHNLRTPDAIHAATAVTAGATLLLSNDAIFRRVPGLAVIVLDDLLS